MSAKMFVAGFISALLIIALLLVGATQIHRATVATIIASAFKHAPVVATPFTDISDLSLQQQDNIGKLYGLKITVGTSAVTFSPSMKTSLYQWFLFIGKALMAAG